MKYFRMKIEKSEKDEELEIKFSNPSYDEKSIELLRHYMRDILKIHQERNRINQNV